MQNNYQFSLKIGEKDLPPSNEPNLLTLFRDLFPNFCFRSVTFAIIIVQFINLISTFPSLTILPSSAKQKNNVFCYLIYHLVWFFIVIRLGSQYERSLGYKYYLFIVIIIQLIRVIIINLRSNGQISLLAINNSSLLSFYVFSCLNIKIWEGSEQIQFRPDNKTVQNYDLLDLNDTVIKLKPLQSSYMYESYTNRQFYLHNITASKEEKIGKVTKNKKQTIKNRRVNRIMDEQTQQVQPKEVKIYKLIAYHFIVFSTYSSYETFILIITQAIIFLLTSSKIVRKWFT